MPRDRSMRFDTLHQLDAIAERIIDINPVIARERLVFGDSTARRGQFGGKAPHVRDEEGGVCLARGAEILLDTQVDFHRTADEPAATSCCQIFGLVDLRNSERSEEHTSE